MASNRLAIRLVLARWAASRSLACSASRRRSWSWNSCHGRTVGGHLTEGCTVRTTAEVVLTADDRLLFDREHDPATGYDELVVREPDP